MKEKMFSLSENKFVSGQTDIFVGKKGNIKRYLVCALQGYFPVLTKIGPNSLAVIYRTGAPHVGITGTLAVSTSKDGGKSWTAPVEIASRGNDNRNPALGFTPDKLLICAYWKAGLHNYEEIINGMGPEWVGDNDRSSARQRKIPAMFITTSPDYGQTWTEPHVYTSKLLTLASPYGRIITLPDGTLLMGVYGRLRQNEDDVRNISILLRSQDGGKTWGEETLVAKKYNETSFVLLPNGRLLAACRSDIKNNVAITFSDDMGFTWNKPQDITGFGEYPADLTLLKSGRVLLSFGRRVSPMGCGLLFSDDNGLTWNKNKEILLAGDGGGWDLGYPSTVQIEDGTIITVLYYASGSAMSEKWGHVSCQALHYTEDILKYFL